MALAVVDYASDSSLTSAGNTTPAVTCPGTASVGDVALVSVTQLGASAISGVPGDWTLINSASVSSNNTTTVYGFVVEAGDIGASLSALTFGVSQRWVMGVLVLSGAGSVADIISAVSSSSSASNTPSNPGITPTADNAIVVSVKGWRNSTGGNTWTGTHATNYTEAIDLCTTNGSSPNISQYVEYRILSGGSGALETPGTDTVSGGLTVTRSNVTLAVYAAGSASASAENAAGTGTAYDVTATVSAAAEAVAATGTAYDATGSISPAAGNAAVTGTANDAAAGISAPAEAATGTGTAYDATVTVSATAGVASGTGTAHSPSVSTSLSANAAADTATGTGTAYDAAVTVASPAENAAGAGTAYDTTVTVSATAEAASGTGTAYDATVTTSSFSRGSMTPRASAEAVMTQRSRTASTMTERDT